VPITSLLCDAKELTRWQSERSNGHNHLDFDGRISGQRCDADGRTASDRSRPQRFAYERRRKVGKTRMG